MDQRGNEDHRKDIWFWDQLKRQCIFVSQRIVLERIQASKIFGKGSDYKRLNDNVPARSHPFYRA